jgi:nicotinamidase-related amidase
MPAKNQDLHGNVPDESAIALIIIDMINDLEFPGGDQLLKTAVPVAERILALKKRARQAHIPIIYANDNFGKWQSDFETQVQHCLKDGVRGEPLARLLKPAADDYFILKPKQSAFFSTTMDTLLTYLKSKTLILTGLTGDTCVLFTAQDAYQRDLHLCVPGDCVASIDADDNRYALNQMERVLKANTTSSTDLDLTALTD